MPSSTDTRRCLSWPCQKLTSIRARETHVVSIFINISDSTTSLDHYMNYLQYMNHSSQLTLQIRQHKLILHLYRRRNICRLEFHPH